MQRKGKSKKLFDSKPQWVQWYEYTDMRTLDNMDLSTIEKYLRHKKLENILKK